MHGLENTEQKEKEILIYVFIVFGQMYVITLEQDIPNLHNRIVGFYTQTAHSKTALSAPHLILDDV